jgi:regulator of protease activity HflC (stomatin/prohibitin superfamily)
METKRFVDMTGGEQIKFTFKIVGMVIGVFLLLAIGFSSFKTIGAGERGVVLRVGAVNRVMTEGLNWKIPFIESVAVMDVRTQKEEATATAASKDLQTVSTTVALNYHLQPDAVTRLWQTVGSGYKDRIIDPAIQEAIKASTSKFTAEELVTKRALVKEDVKLLLTERLAKEFIVVDEFSIINFDFSPEFNASIEKKVTAQQDALASENKLKQVQFEAEQRISQAKGEAEAIRIQAQAIQSQGGADYVKLQWIRAWGGGGAQVPQVVSGAGGGNFLFDLNSNSK